MVLPFPECHKNGITSYLVSVSDCFHLTKCSWDFFMKCSRDLFTLLQGSVDVPFYSWVVCHCMDVQVVYPLISWWTFRLFWVWGYYEWICYKHFHGSLEIYLYFISPGSRIDMNSFMLNLKWRQNCFPKYLYHFVFSPEIHKSSSFSTSSTALGIVLLILDTVESDSLSEYLMVSPCGFNFYFLGD